MSNKNKSALLPKLRFPEFRGVEGWNPGTLASACDLQAGKFVPAASISEHNQKGMFPCFGGNGLRGFTATYTHDGTYPLIGRQGALCGNVRFAQGRFHATEHAVVATPKNQIDVGWLYYCLDLLNLNRYATGQAQPGLSVDVLNNVALAIPHSSVEQQKIANCLSSLDELIAAQARKVDALKTHKRGLMQQLFPREGETQPRLRFPEFQGTTGWTLEKIENLAKRGSGHTPSKSVPEYYGGGVKWVSLADSKRLDAGFISETETNISELGIKNSSAVLHPAGAVLISRDAGVGKSAVMAVPMAVSQHFIVWVCDNQKLCNWFLYYLLQLMKPIFERIATGSTIKTIGLPFFKELSIAVPSVSEQKRIADCLTSLDTLITTATQELETLKTHKKGLMQQLFPSVEAGEG